VAVLPFENLGSPEDDRNYNRTLEQYAKGLRVAPGDSSLP
jgi:hypothetical protein